MTIAVAVFAVATVLVFVFGSPLAGTAQAIAERHGINEVLAGAVLLGAITSLPGLVLTTTAALRGDAELAVANALGGVAAQTAFIAIADVAYRRRPLSGAVQTRDVAFQAALLLAMLALVVLGLETAGTTWLRVHPVSLALLAVYAIGLRLGARMEVPVGEQSRLEESERVESPSETVVGDEGAQDGSEAESRALWARFAMLATVLVGAGFALAVAGQRIAQLSGLSTVAVGVLLTSVATSTPELVTAVSAARRGAIGLAAGDIIGGNVFDTLFISAADLATSGSVFAGAGDRAVQLAAVALLMNAVLLAGMVRKGAGAYEVDVENVAIIAIWVVAGVLIVAA